MYTLIKVYLKLKKKYKRKIKYFEMESPYTLSETQNKGTDLSVQAKILFWL